MVHIGNDWDELLDGEFDKEYYRNLRRFLISEYKTRVIYPSMYDIFNALKHTPYSKVKAVILGQDPYHGPDRPTVCVFSDEGRSETPSLENIFKELKRTWGFRLLSRVPYGLGRTWRPAVEYGSYGAFRPGKFT